MTWTSGRVDGRAAADRFDARRISDDLRRPLTLGVCALSAAFPESGESRRASLVVLITRSLLIGHGRVAEGDPRFRTGARAATRAALPIRTRQTLADPRRSTCRVRPTGMSAPYGVVSFTWMERVVIWLVRTALRTNTCDNTTSRALLAVRCRHSRWIGRVDSTYRTSSAGVADWHPCTLDLFTKAWDRAPPASA